MGHAARGRSALAPTRRPLRAAGRHRAFRAHRAARGHRRPGPRLPRMMWLQHDLVRLALHQLADGDGRPLLLLHGLGEASPAEQPEWSRTWTGPVHALEFTGHGQSTVPKGGGYTAEVLMADADAALAAIGPATVVGRGVGAYVALLIAGARPRLVRGAVLCDGPGLQGGGDGPTSNILFTVDASALVPPDPWALIELSRDV